MADPECGDNDERRDRQRPDGRTDHRQRHDRSGGNAFGALAGSTAVLGTTDANALDLRANNARVMRFEPNAISPNVIGGHPANNVTAGVRGATIGGGGVASGDTDPVFPFKAPNVVTDACGQANHATAQIAGLKAKDTGAMSPSSIRRSGIAPVGEAMSGTFLQSVLGAVPCGFQFGERFGHACLLCWGWKY